jgi:hypothetical protein
VTHDTLPLPLAAFCRIIVGFAVQVNLACDK